MATLLTQRDLRTTLFEFKDILGNFDFSAIKNIRFISQDAFFAYVESVENNPFKKQLEELNKRLDVLQPYLPFVNSERASEFLGAIASATSEEASSQIKKDFTQKLRDDFVGVARTLSNNEQWEHVLNTCEEIRLHKEESTLVNG
ncbi:MAG: hypothetical protein ATN35_06945 [Epulopiscium sp. Nele67-Bin004]|nr:MAG: hypothetical protein ATN35_06945 [Epulopiscium sp. Nele67-Bin004]